MRLIIILLSLITFSSTYASNDKITQGVSEFLLERAEDNYLYMFENKLKTDRNLACYFPNTFKYIRTGDFKTLLQANELWKESMEADIESLVAKSVAFQINKTHDLSKIAVDATNEYLDLTEYLYIEDKNQKYDLNVLPLNRSLPVVNQINKFYFDFLDFRDQLLKLSQFLEGFDNICQAPTLTVAEFFEKVTVLKNAFDQYTELLEYIVKNKNDLHVNLKKLNVDCMNGKSQSKACELRENLLNEFLERRNGDLTSTVEKVLVSATLLKNYASRANHYQSQAARVVLAFRELPKNSFAKNTDLEKLKTNALFFAQLADANSAEAVSAILKKHTLPSVSFFVKRENNKFHVLLSSYLGLAAGTGLTDKNGLGEDYGQSIFAPVGLELSYGIKNQGAISIMASVLDFGYPVSLKLNNVDDEVDLNQIVAPSLSVSYGFRNYPVVVGATYQKGRKDLRSNEFEDFSFLFIAYDMPLFTLF